MISKSGILFDLDGTLIDTLNDITAAYNTVLTEYGMENISREALKPLVSQGSPYMIPLSFKVKLSDPAYHSIRDKILKQYQAECSQRSQLFPGIRELINQLNAKKLPWGIVTNKLEGMAVDLIERFHLSSHCQVLVGGDTLSTCKPDPAPLLYAAKKMQRQPVELYYVGDSSRDVLAANAAGIDSITLTHGYNNEDLTTAEYKTILIDDPLVVLEYIYNA